MIYNCLQQPAILEPVASIFDNDDDVEIEVVQESGNMDSDMDMIPRTEFSSRHSSSHYSVPPTTVSDRDMAMPNADEDSDEPEAVQARSKHRQQSSKSNSSTQSVCDCQYTTVSGSTCSFFLSDFSSTSEGISCRGLYHFIRRFLINYHSFHIETKYPEDCQCKQEKT